MKKKRFLFVLVALITAFALFAFTACAGDDNGGSGNGGGQVTPGGTGGEGGGGEPEPPAHVHAFSHDWTFDAEHHWHDCTGCDEKDGFAAHVMDGANCTVCDFKVAPSALAYEAIEEGGSVTAYKVTGWAADATDKTTLNIPETYDNAPVTEIADNAFSAGTVGEEEVLHDDTLKIAVFPSSLKTIGSNAFAGNSGLALIPALKDLDSIGDFAFWDCLALTEVSIENVANVGTAAFYGCAALTKADLKNTETIGSYPFYNCTSLAFATVDGVTTIGNYLFYNCPALDTTTLLSGFAELPNQMFYNSSNNASSNVKKIVLGTEFKGERTTWPKSLEYIEVDPQNESLTSENGVLYNKAMTEINCVPNNYKGRLALHDGLTKIGLGAIMSHPNITSLTIPSSVSEITNMSIFEAFDDCYRLAEVFNFSSVSLDNASDYGLTDLTAVITSASEKSKVTDPDKDGFVWLEGEPAQLIAYFGDKTDVVLPESYGGKNYEVRSRAFYLTDIKSVTSTAGVTAFGEDSFAWSTVESVSLAEGLINMGAGSFRFCKSLTELSLPKSLEVLGAGAFGSCTALKTAKFAGDINDWAKIDIPNTAGFNHESIRLLLNGKDDIPEKIVIENVEHIGRCAFAKTGVKTVVIGRGVKEIDQEAFLDCTNLTVVVIGPDVEYVSDWAFLQHQTCTIEKLYYEGTAEKMSTINTNAVGGLAAASGFDEATVYYYEANDPQGKPGNFWHWNGSDVEEW